MIRQPSTRVRILFARTTLAVLAIFATITASRPTVAADLAEQAHSLRKVPADAAFYSTSLRLKEQWDAFVESKAYGNLMEIPLFQLAKMQVTFQWQQSNEPAVAQIREYIQSPAGQDAVAVLKEMFTDEVFAYGGSNIADWMKLFLEINSMASRVRVDVSADGEEDSEKAAAEKLFDKISERLAGQASVPTFVVGFRIKNADRAKRELDEIDSLLRKVLKQHQPELAAHLQRGQVAGHEFLTMRLDGSMIPWEKIREDSEDITEKQLESIRNAISKKTLVVALGVVDEFVLLSVGSTTDHLEKIGQGSMLAEQPAIQRLAKHADQKVVSVTYMSKAFAQSLGSPQQTIESVANSVEMALIGADVDEEDRKTILDDIRAFNLAKYVPEAGETSAIAYLTARGYEAFKYTAAKRPMMDSSKPLTILSHVGGSPMLVIASRSKENIDDYKQAVDWLKRIAGHAEKIAEKKADPEDWTKYQQYRDRGVALLERLDRANREHLFPALADGQSAFVMDLAAKSKKWFEQMPESPKPLPMLELAIVASVSDAEKLRQGVTTYIDVARDAYKLIKEIEPDETPNIKLPKAAVSDLAGGGKLYTYPLPKQWGIDSQVAVNAGLTDKFAAVSLMPKTTERLLQEQASSIDTSLPLDHPAAMVVHIEFAKLVNATRPWIDYGLNVAMGKFKPKAETDEESDDSDESDESDESAPPRPPSSVMLQMGLIVPQIQQLLDVATTLRSATSITYEEDGVWVTHSETRIEDLK